MRALVRESQKYVISTEWELLAPESKHKPTTWHIRVQTGEEMLRWNALREQIENDRKLHAEDKAQQIVRLDSDLFAAAIVCVEDWETGVEGEYETTRDQKRIREIVSLLGKTEREELGVAIVLQGRLSLGEPDRLRLQLTSFYGESPSPAASATTTANDAPRPEASTSADA